MVYARRVGSDRYKRLSNISEDLKTFQEATEAGVQHDQNTPSLPNHQENIYKKNQLLAKMQKRIGTKDLAKWEASKQPQETDKTARIAALRSPSTNNVSQRTPGDGRDRLEERAEASDLILPVEATLNAGVI